MTARGNWKVRECAETVGAFLETVYTGRSGEEKETQMCDVLADLMHFAYRYHLDFDAALDSARNHHEVEKQPGFSEGRG